MKKTPVFQVGYGENVGLDPKMGFDAWVEAGSTKKGANLLNDMGIVNRLGNKVTAMNVWYAAWRWILENDVQAKPFFDEDRRLINKPIYTQEEWLMLLLKKAMTIYEHKRGAFEGFLLKHNLYKDENVGETYRYKYPRLYEKYFGGGGIQEGSEGEVQE